MVTTVGAINKKDVNNLYKESEKVGGEKPIDLIRATAPVQVLTSKYFDTLQSIGAKGNMIVVVPEGGNDTILNLPTPRG